MADRRRRRRRASQDSEDDDESASGSDSGTSGSPSTKNRAREAEPPEAAAVRVEAKKDVESECVSSCEPSRILARRAEGSPYRPGPGHMSSPHTEPSGPGWSGLS